MRERRKELFERRSRRLPLLRRPNPDLPKLDQGRQTMNDVPEPVAIHPTGMRAGAKEPRSVLHDPDQLGEPPTRLSSAGVERVADGVIDEALGEFSMIFMNRHEKALRLLLCGGQHVADGAFTPTITVALPHECESLLFRRRTERRGRG